ncbi:hypothetical protein [Neokomagataea thailandica]|uniref:Uncharacterized protein n=1 Tax=Neokomagataea tanensis NBRC 106556 TaxID=1223519 RepID=A0ABQ0QHI6_9PROT|nr:MULTISPECIES: hypothetical protein [Neokomagataea]GBR45036.1 hypothetical protein AA106556_0630 [Neokomagataea tanensis NBRC 106556]
MRQTTRPIIDTGRLENCTILSPTDPKTVHNTLGFLKTLRYGPTSVYGVAVRHYHHTMHVTYTKGGLSAPAYEAEKSL